MSQAELLPCGSNPLATLSTINSPLLSRPCRAFLENWGVPAPAVVLRFTAGYAFHTPSGVKSEKRKFY
ncbi:MAG: hypothetical protein LBE12_11840 [Planctomycetaceae bacterium]|nr:hypothetical protein [Planctomycetaceae bacterium]